MAFTLTAVYGDPAAMFGAVEYGVVSAAASYALIAATIAGTSELSVDVINYAKSQCPVIAEVPYTARVLAVDVPVAVVIRTYVGSLSELEVECE